MMHLATFFFTFNYCFASLSILVAFLLLVAFSYDVPLFSCLLILLASRLLFDVFELLFCYFCHLTNHLQLIAFSLQFDTFSHSLSIAFKSFSNFS